jgi:ELWxxDGT repeat protein
MVSRLSCALLLGLGLLPLAAGAQPASMVKDIDPRRGDNFTSAEPQDFLTVGGRLFFTTLGFGGVWVTDGTPGSLRHLPALCEDCSPPRFVGSARGLAFWLDSASHQGDLVLVRSDGTRAGTFPLTSALSIEIEEPSLESYPTLAGNLYFPACGASACSLWRTDGTREGTRPAVNLGRGRFFFEQMTVAGGKIYFVPHFQAEIWASDGTAAGTELLASIDSGDIGMLTSVGNKLFFVAGLRGDPEVWVSDGTAAGTHAVSQIPGTQEFSWRWLKPIGNRVYFVADDVTHGEEIWRSDGTLAGTVRVTEFGYHRPFSFGLRPRGLEEVNGRLVFFATDGLTGEKLWATDGRPESTVALARSCTEDCSSDLRGLARAGTRIIFRGEDDAHGGEPWSTNGTPAGTSRLADLCPGTCSGMDSAPLALGRKAYFAAEGQLWASNGTAVGTRRQTDFTTAQSRLNLPFEEIAALGPKVFFSGGGIYGAELWSTTGKPGETQIVGDLAPRGGVGSETRDLLAFGNRLLFTVQGNHGPREIWSSTGTAATTLPLGAPPQDVCDFCNPENLTRALNLFFFTARGQVWRSDGTAGGTLKLTDFQGNLELPTDPEFAELGGRLFFFVDGHGSTRSHLWKSDGTPQGTGKVLDLPEHVRVARDLTALDSRLYFTVANVGSTSEVWVSDGTAAGTRTLIAIDSFFGPVRAVFKRAGSTVVFMVFDFVFSELWRTDGTTAGTVQLGGNLGESPYPHLAEFQGAVYLFTELAAEFILWRSDGSAAGTVKLRQFPKDSLAWVPNPEFTVLGNRIFFVAGEDASGLELWQSDGTAQGTTIVRDILPGEYSSTPSGLTAAGNRLFFTADDGVHGRELWETDGTEAGTRLVHDIAPESYSSSPEEITAVGDRLFFSADDGIHGVELWTLLLGGGGACQPSPTTLCLGGGRFKVEAAWRDFAGNTGTGQAVPLSADTGYFWFFNPENVETVVKVLDGRGVNGHRWVFYGALSNVEYDLTVTDTETGLTRRYFNPAYQFASVGDTYGFGPLGAAKARVQIAPASPPPVIKERFDPAAATGVCAPSATRLCLNGGRFAVEVSWKDFSNRTGVGTAVNLTPDTGYFWFFNAENVELMVKVLDGRPITGKFWVFYGALSNVEYTLTVTDTQTGKSKEYKNAIGRFGSVGDTGAF